ncbi:MAG: MBL fold metallo-hydrolase [Flavobacteriales bacterium]|nr:MBL fold metallo-hydrolase [Flavobacteriales bacterium]
MAFLYLLGILVLLVLAFLLYFAFAPRIGGRQKGERARRIEASPNSVKGRFRNVLDTDMDMPLSAMGRVLWEMIKGGGGREPEGIIPTVRFDAQQWEAIPSGTFATAWFGHSSLLIKAGGKTILVDPVFGERASTFSFAGPKRFEYDAHMTVEGLPHVDVVLLSHDHYDHLDHFTIDTLVRSGAKPRYIAPLGVGAHLERWGVQASSITEMDRWDELDIGSVRLTLVPSRHFSGRGLSDRFTTLWGAWVIEAGGARVFFGADSGPSPTFKEIGERFGPFDLVMLECGAYNELWPNIHMLPEETAQAAVDLKAAVLMPIHWGKFSLALHPWKEPVTRLIEAAGAMGVPLLTPRIGRIVPAADRAFNERWWDEVDGPAKKGSAALASGASQVPGEGLNV